MKTRLSTMKTVLSLVLAVTAVQLVSASVIRDKEPSLEKIAAPSSLQPPPVAPKTPQAPEHGTKVVAHAVEHTEEHDDQLDDKIVGYDPNVRHPESFIVSPEDKLYAEFADSPNADETEKSL